MNTIEYGGRSIMEDLWLGQVGQEQLHLQDRPEYHRIMALLEQPRADFEGSLSEEQKKLLIAYEDRLGAYDSFTETAIFRYGFRLGARMMLEVLSEEDGGRPKE